MRWLEHVEFTLRWSCLAHFAFFQQSVWFQPFTLIQSRRKAPSCSKIDSSEDCSQEKQIDEVEVVESNCTQTKLIYLAFLAAILFFVEGMENTTCGYLVEFLISTQLRVSTAINMNAVFSAVYAIVRLIGLALIVKPMYIIVGDLLILGVANCVFYYYFDSTIYGIWFATVLTTIGVSTIFGNLVSYTSQLVTVPNSVGSLILLSSVTSSAVYLLIIGANIDSHPIVMIQQNLYSIVISLALHGTLISFDRLQDGEVARWRLIELESIKGSLAVKKVPCSSQLNLDPLPQKRSNVVCSPRSLNSASLSPYLLCNWNSSNFELDQKKRCLVVCSSTWMVQLIQLLKKNSFRGDKKRFELKSRREERSRSLPEARVGVREWTVERGY